MAFANYWYLRALAIGNLSETQPMLALSPVFLLVTTPLMTNDVVTPLGWIGVLLVAAGIYATQHPGRNPETGALPSFLGPFIRMWKAPGVSLMFGVAFIFSIAANLDKLAVLASDGPTYLMVDAALTVLLTSIVLGAGVLLKKLRLPSFHHMSAATAALAPAAMSESLIGFAHMWALTLLPVPYVITIKRLSIVFASLWGYFLRRERAPHWYRILGMLMAFAGVAFIIMFGKI